MDRIINALKYGDSETRKCIGSVLLFSVLGLVFVAVSALLTMVPLFIAGLTCGVVAIVVSQTFTLVDAEFKPGDAENGTISVMKNGKSSSEIIAEKAKAKEEKEKEKEALKNGESADAKEGDKEKEASAEDADAAVFDAYDKAMLKKVMRKYRVKKDHRPILIDSSAKYKIKECPAFIWCVHTKIFILLLEKEPRRIMIPRGEILNMGYAAKVKADKAKEYKAFEKTNLITEVFKEFLPDYFDSKAENKNLKYKNLYLIGPDIRISNRCAYKAMDLLHLNFMPKDKITESEKVNGYFKRVYAAHIMYQDRVLSINEYKDTVEKVLTELCYADMPYAEFKFTLDGLVKGRMISQEYEDHYMDVRAKANDE